MLVLLGRVAYGTIRNVTLMYMTVVQRMCMSKSNLIWLALYVMSVEYIWPIRERDNHVLQIHHCDTFNVNMGHYEKGHSLWFLDSSACNLYMIYGFIFLKPLRDLWVHFPVNFTRFMHWSAWFMGSSACNLYVIFRFDCNFYMTLE